MSYSKQELITRLQDLANELGRTPKENDIDKRDDYPSSRTYSNHFGSWTAALDEAGLPQPTHERQKRYDDDELVQLLQEAAEELGHAPTQREIIDKDEHPYPQTYMSHFGSWNNALEEAGLEPNAVGSYEKEELLDRLKDLADEIGHTPSKKEIADSDEHPSPRAYRYNFGTWTNAVEAAGLEPRTRQKYDREELISLLQEAADKVDGLLTKKKFRRLDEYPSVLTYRKRFGSWNDAKEEAGVEIAKRIPKNGPEKRKMRQHQCEKFLSIMERIDELVDEAGQLDKVKLDNRTRSDFRTVQGIVRKQANKLLSQYNV